MLDGFRGRWRGAFVMLGGPNELGVPVKRLAALVSLLSVLALASDAAAGPRIVTSRLTPPPDGSLVCAALNASTRKEVQVSIVIYTFDGEVASGPYAVAIPPNQSVAYPTSNDNARHCVVDVLKGGKKNVRVTVEARDVSGTLIAALQSP